MTSSNGRARVTSKAFASFAVPVLAAVALLYQGLAVVDISVAEPATLMVIGGALAIAAVLGLAAAFGGERTRVVVFAAMTVLLLDTTVHPSRLFDAMYPAERLAARRDARRVADLHRIKDALDAYIREAGPLPAPRAYGEGTGPATFWAGWWDLSAADGNSDGHPFLDFLEARGVRVPVDPLNTTPDPADPRLGNQYVYFIAPVGYLYQGGTCEAWAGKSAYLVGMTRFETEGAKRSEASATACRCLWRDAPDFFQQYFDYMLCGTFEP